MDELARSHLAPLPSKPNALQVSEKGGSEGGRRRKGRGETATGLRSVALHPAGGLGRAAPGRVRTARRDRTGPCAEFGAGALGPLATSGQARGPRTEAHAAGRGAEPAVSGVKRGRTGGARETRRGGTQGAARRAGRGPGGAEGGAAGARGPPERDAAPGAARARGSAPSPKPPTPRATAGPSGGAWGRAGSAAEPPICPAPRRRHVRRPGRCPALAGCIPGRPCASPRPCAAPPSSLDTPASRPPKRPKVGTRNVACGRAAAAVTTSQRHLFGGDAGATWLLPDLGEPPTRRTARVATPRSGFPGAGGNGPCTLVRADEARYHPRRAGADPGVASQGARPRAPRIAHRGSLARVGGCWAVRAGDAPGNALG